MQFCSMLCSCVTLGVVYVQMIVDLIREPYPGSVHHPVGCFSCNRAFFVPIMGSCVATELGGCRLSACWINVTGVI